MGGLRLIAGEQAWWAISGGLAARLPTDAVTDSDASPELWVDTLRGRALVPEAVSALSSAGFFTEARGTYALTVLTATNCNLGCAYCFQNVAPPSAGSFAPPRIATKVLSRATSEAVSDFARRQMDHVGALDASLLIFGGEPLLNVAGCQYLLDALAPLALRSAEIVTNGVLLTEAVAQTLVDHGLTRVQISFDGAREEHDATRVTRNGRATYGEILRNVVSVARSHPSLAWNLRVNVSHRNVERLHHLVADLAGAVEPASEASFRLALIDDTGLGYDNHVGYDQSWADRFIALNDQAINAGLSVPHTRPLTECPYCSTRGEWGAVINADGTLYSCWENAGRDGWDLGTVREGYDESKLHDRWVACDFDIRPHGDPDQGMRFLDQIDAAALDAQYRCRTLTPVTAS